MWSASTSAGPPDTARRIPGGNDVRVGLPYRGSTCIDHLFEDKVQLSPGAIVYDDRRKRKPSQTLLVENGGKPGVRVT
ncbi:hypothetical protein BG004_004174 [Podila humilis]|nr:hypothetical protein BG004_004174 [Podila humilis]